MNTAFVFGVEVQTVEGLASDSEGRLQPSQMHLHRWEPTTVKDNPYPFHESMRKSSEIAAILRSTTLLEEEEPLKARRQLCWRILCQPDTQLRVI